jgi:regulation of enolase protein 1 (concanavalin A-like superfamily)
MKRMTMVVIVLVLVLGLGSMASAQLPAGWSQTDIGGASPVGSASYDQATGTWTVTGDGQDIWDTWDSFHFVFRRLKGDGMMTARVVSITGAGLHEWAKAGVMIRESLNPDSRHAMVAMNPGTTQNHAAQFAWRATTGGYSDHSADGSMALPYWVRIERVGNAFRGYISPNGNTWTQQGTAQTISMSQDVYIGLLVLSHVAGQLGTDRFDNVTIQGELIEEVPVKAITYQGRLLDGDIAADGLYDLQFSLYDAQTGGSQKGQTVAIEDMDVIEGYFTVDLDFGEGAFDGNPRWLQIAVRPAASTGNLTILDPRQRIAPTPYALYAFSGAGGGAGGDDLGDHTATQNINLDGHYLSGDGSDKGIYVDSRGYVGIGTSAPGYDLDVAGTIRATGTAVGLDAQIMGVSNSNTTGVKGYSNNGEGVNGESNSNFGVHGASRSGTGVCGEGFIGVSGRSEDGGGAGVHGYNSSGYAGYFDGMVGINAHGGAALYVSEAEAIWYDGTQFSWGFGGNWNYFSDGVCIGGTAANPSPHKLVVNGSAAKTGGGSWSSISDARLKDVQGDYKLGLAEVARLNPVFYKYTAHNDMDLPTERQYVGVVAQEVRQVIPEAVEENTDGYLMLNNDPIIWAMVNAIKELKAENDALKQRLDILERKADRTQSAITKEVQP